MYDLESMKDADLELLHASVNKIFSERKLKEEDEEKKAFLKSNAAVELKKRILQVQKDYKSMPKTGKINFEIEVSITLKPYRNVENLFEEEPYREELFECAYKGKVLNADKLGNSKELQNALNEVLSATCIDAIDFDKELGERTNNLVKEIDKIIVVLDKHLVNSNEVLKVK